MHLFNRCCISVANSCDALRFRGYLEIPCSMVEVPPFTWERLGESHADVLGLGYFILPLDCHHLSAVYSVSVAAYRIQGILSDTVLYQRTYHIRENVPFLYVPVLYQRKWYKAIRKLRSFWWLNNPYLCFVWREFLVHFLDVHNSWVHKAVCTPHSWERLRFTCLLRGFEALWCADFAFSQLMASWNKPSKSRVMLKLAHFTVLAYCATALAQLKGHRALTKGWEQEPRAAEKWELWKVHCWISVLCARFLKAQPAACLSG